MNTIKKKYIVDENNARIAVQLDIKTFDKIEQLLEDYALHELMNENNDDKLFSINEAKEYYNVQKKSD